MNIFHIIMIQTCLEPQNDCLNLSFVNYIHVVAKNIHQQDCLYVNIMIRKGYKIVFGKCTVYRDCK